MSEKVFRCFWNGLRCGVIALLLALILLIPAGILIRSGAVSAGGTALLSFAALFLGSVIAGAILGRKGRGGLVGSLFCGLCVMASLLMLSLLLNNGAENASFSLLNCAIATIGNYASRVFDLLRHKT